MSIKKERRVIMWFLKGTIIGLTFGALVGMVIGATNHEYMEDMFRKSRKEVKRFKRKYGM